MRAYVIFHAIGTKTLRNACHRNTLCLIRLYPRVNSVSGFLSGNDLVRTVPSLQLQVRERYGLRVFVTPKRILVGSMDLFVDRWISRSLDRSLVEI